MKKLRFHSPTQRQFTIGFFAVVALLALCRLIFGGSDDESPSTLNPQPSSLLNPHPNRIWSVPSYKDAFPDAQDVQILAANKWGVRPVKIVRMPSIVRRSWSISQPTPITTLTG